MDYRQNTDNPSRLDAGETRAPAAGPKPGTRLPLHAPEPRKSLILRRSLPEANSKTPGMIRQLYALLDELHRLVPRPFALEGSLDDSVGETMAAAMYGLVLLERHARVSVAETAEGRQIQLKVTRSRKGTVGLYERPESLLVLQLSGRNLIELYNGPTSLPWQNAGKIRKGDQRRIPVSRLRATSLSVAAADKLSQQQVVNQ